ATLEPQIAANSVQATTETRPSEPGRPPSHTVARSTRAAATPPNRMKVAAMTNSGSAIRVGELSSLTMSWATPTSGWPDSTYIAPAHRPSTRNTGMRHASSAANSDRKPAITRASLQPAQLVGAGAGRHRGGVGGHELAEPNDVAQEHQG